MTSFIIKAHVDRPPAPLWAQDNIMDCTFCRIIRKEMPAYKVYEDDAVIAILDIQPLRDGHTLVIPKYHCKRVSELAPEYAAACGKAVSRVSKALTEVLDNTALNVVCNQEYAQAVPHVHYHIIPAPRLGAGSTLSTTKTLAATNPQPAKEPTQREMHRMEFESRHELEEEAAEDLVGKLRAKL